MRQSIELEIHLSEAAKKFPLSPCGSTAKSNLSVSSV